MSILNTHFVQNVRKPTDRPQSLLVACRLERKNCVYVNKFHISYADWFIHLFAAQQQTNLFLFYGQLRLRYQLQPFQAQNSLAKVVHALRDLPTEPLQGAAHGTSVSDGLEAKAGAEPCSRRWQGQPKTEAFHTSFWILWTGCQWIFRPNHSINISKHIKA